MMAAFKMLCSSLFFCGHFESRGAMILYRGRALCSVHSQLKRESPDREDKEEFGIILKELFG